MVPAASADAELLDTNVPARRSSGTAASSENPKMTW